MADAVGCAVAGRRTPNGATTTWSGSSLRSPGTTLRSGLCGSCMDTRGVDEGALVEGARRSSLDELADWTLRADKVVSF
jgi:uncharacterized protein involved in oxidation of intracellular sulfur